MLRITAGVLLMFWLAAMGLCVTECQGDDIQSGAAQMGQTADSASQSHDSGKDDHRDDSFCASLHSLTTPSPCLAFVKPDFGLSFTLDFISTAQLVAVTPLETSISRQPPDREFVFTPEVWLGAAFRSLAPPVLL